MHVSFFKKINPAVLFMLLLFLLPPSLILGQQIKIKVEGGKVYMWPYKDSRVITHLSRDEEVLIKARIGDWYRVHLLPDDRGMIKSGFIHKNVLSDRKEKKLKKLGAFAIEINPESEPGFSGELVSLKFKDADIRDVILCLCSIGRLNVVFDPDVSGKTTLSLHDVPWDQALDVILKTNHLGKEIKGNVLRAAKRDTLLKKFSLKTNPKPSR